jgi:CheY-like chemotaxis protein
VNTPVGRVPLNFRLKFTRQGAEPDAGEREAGGVQTIQQILFACPVNPRLSQLAQALKELEMAVLTAPSFGAARQVVERLPGLALVVIDAESSVSDATRLLAQIKDRNRRLPVLWLGAAPSGSQFTPESLLPSTAAIEQLRESAQALLADNLYPPTLVRALVSACNTALTTTFECPVECAEPHLSRSVVRPGNISALMFVSDDDTTAHFILSSTEWALSSLAERIGFDASEGQRQLAVDMASELINQIVGRMKANVDSLSTLRIALPYIVTGEQLCIYAPTPKPSLNVQVDLADAQLTVDFWFKTRLQPNLEAERFMAQLSAGDGLF